MTGDASLRKMALASGIEVRGIIYLFDELLSQEIISCKNALEKIEQLITINNRLPKEAIEVRIRLWQKDKLFVDGTEEE